MYQIMTKLDRNQFKLDVENPEVNVVITIYFNSELSSKKALGKPFTFSYPLNFDTTERTQEVTVSFDAWKV